jgi:phage terminase large subunit GpA-like protein
MPTAADVYSDAFRAGLRPDPVLTVSEWADRYRKLSGKAAAEPGPWRTDRTPYLREIMDALSPSSPVERVVFMKGSQIGGPLSLDTPVPTVQGWTTMGTIQPGDQVFDENGFPCRVLNVSPVLVNQECYQITFSDGSTIIADGNHPWVVWDDLGRRKRRLIRTTTAVMFLRHKARGGKANRYAIDVAGPLMLPQVDLPVDPYLLGYWLGNGSAGMNHITVHEDDYEVAGLLSTCGVKVEFRLPWWRKGKAANILIDGGRRRLREEDGSFGPVAVADGETYFMGALRDLGVVRNKHIPPCYLRASFPQRLALLQGLMDSDGHITKAGRCEFTTHSPKLRDGVYELLMTLGIKATIYNREGHERLILGRPCRVRDGWRISFMVYDDLPVFRLRRKLARLTSRDGRRCTETERRRVVDIRPIPSVPVRCIAVDSPSHLFLAGRSMIPTHNTEAGNNWVGYVIHKSPGPMMVVQPTVELAKRNSKQRIDPLIEESDVLRELVKSPRSRDSGNTVLSKEFPGGVLVMTGANSAVGLRSMAVRYLFLDEIDAYPGDVDGEGDPINLAFARTRTFSRRKVFMCSTPLITGLSRIEAAFAESDQRHYWVPCPHCGEFQTLKFERLRWPKGEPRKAAYHCIACEQPIFNHQKNTMLARGEWRPEAAGDGRTRGYHLSSLYSPVGWYSWERAAEDWEKAQGDVERLKSFVNLVLGESWQERGDAPDWQPLYDRREDYPIGTVPRGGLFLTAGADVQRDRIEVEVVAWGRGKESWSVDYRVLMGDTARADVWRQLDALLDEEFPHASGVRLPIRVLCVDSGFNPRITYDWVRQHPQASWGPAGARAAHPRTAVAVKGTARTDRLILGASPVDSSRRRGTRLWTLGTPVAKSELYSRLRLAPPTEESGEPFPAGYCHFPRYEEDYFRQLTAESLVKGHWVVAPNRRNEALDCRVYARAAASIYGIDRFTEKHWRELETLLPAPVTQPELAAPHQPRPVRRRTVTSNWMKR